MTTRTFTDDQLRRIGGLKWTGIRAKDGSPTIGAWVAEMDFGTDPQVADTMKSAIDDGLLGYQPTWLAEHVSEALAQFERCRFGWELDPAHIRLAESVLLALRATISHLVRPGAPIIVPTPNYMPFLTMPGELGHPVIEVPSLHGEAAHGRGWELDLDGIRAAFEEGAGLLILCNPWNPTGRVLSAEELRAVHAVVSDYDALLFSDEIHAPLVFDDSSAFISYARLGPEFAARTVTATAASKGWNIAGLPCAQVILPDEALRQRWDEFGSEVAHGASTIGALGAITAFTHDDSWQREVLSDVRANVDLVEDALAGTPVDFTRPQATYLTWWGFGAVPLEPSPAAVLRERAHVATNAGVTLGTGYEQWARFNLACSNDVTSRIIESVLGVLPR